MSLSQPTELHYFACSLCKTVMATVLKSRYRNCNGCFRWMKFQFTVPIETDEQRAIAARGTVFNPHPQPIEPWVCHRCGKTFTVESYRYRLDGKVCLPCAKAEEGPPRPPTTQAEHEAYVQRYTDLISEDIDRQEAAYQHLEGQEK